MAVTFTPEELDAAGLLDGFKDKKFGAWFLTNLEHPAVQALLRVDATADADVVRDEVRDAYVAILAAYEDS